MNLFIDMHNEMILQRRVKWTEVLQLRL